MISVIVPVYNVEAYLPRCIESILAQSYKNFELLLVDDGSPDNCGAICEEYAKTDKRIRVFHKENGGQSSARNYGLDRMKGNYITFVDSDDYIGPNYLQILYDMIHSYDVDASILSISCTTSIGIETVDSEDKRIILDRQMVFRELLISRKFSVSPCMKLFKKYCFDKVRFPEGRIYEDLSTIPYILDKCERCAYSTSKQYYYFYREGSTMNSISISGAKMWLEAIDKLLDYTKLKYPHSYGYAQTQFVREVFNIIIDWYLCNEHYNTIVAQLKHQYNKYFLKAIALPNLTVKERIKSILFWINKDFYRFIRIRWIKFKNDPYRMKYIKGKP